MSTYEEAAEELSQHDRLTRADIVDILERKLPSGDIRFLLSFVPEWARSAPKGLDPTMYGTLTAAGDQAVVDRVKSIQERWGAK